jgi:hypothetical protein
MRPIRLTPLFCATAFILILAGCGSSSPRPTPTGGFTAGILNGTYAFAFSGTDANGFFAVAGSLQADGAGHITGGVEDINRGAGINTNVPITGTYSVRPDGRGVAVINSSAGNFNLAFVVDSSQHAFVSRFEASGTASGSLDMQNSAAFSTAALAGTFAFNVSGIDATAAANALTSVGSVTLDNAGNVTAGVQDSSDNGVILAAQAITPAGSSITVGATNGRGTATLVTTTGTLTFAFYIVDANHLKLVQTNTGTALAGDAFRQSGPFTNASLSGPFAFAAAGANASIGGPFVAGGVLTSNGAGVVSSGTEDINNVGSSTANLALTGTYSISSARGTLTITNTAGTFNFAIYPTTGGVQVIELDTGLVVSGQALQQTGTFSTSSLQGPYAMNFAAVSTAGELDSTAEFTANGTGSLTGITDINNVGTVSSGTVLQGTYTVGATGRGPFTLNSGLGTQNMAIYMVDSTRALFVELDSGVVAIGELRHQ